MMSLINMIVPGAYMGSLDNRDAYNSIPISENISNFTNFIGMVNILLFSVCSIGIYQFSVL